MIKLGSGSVHFQNYVIQDTVFGFKDSFWTGYRSLCETHVLFFEKGEEKNKRKIENKKIKEKKKKGK